MIVLRLVIVCLKLFLWFYDFLWLCETILLHMVSYDLLVVSSDLCMMFVLLLMISFDFQMVSCHCLWFPMIFIWHRMIFFDVKLGGRQGHNLQQQQATNKYNSNQHWKPNVLAERNIKESLVQRVTFLTCLCLPGWEDREVDNINKSRQHCKHIRWFKIGRVTRPTLATTTTTNNKTIQE